MSTAALTAAAAALWPTLRRVLIRIGKRVLVWLVEHGAPWLLRLMRRTVEQIERDIEDAKRRTAEATRETGLNGKRRWRMRRRRLQRRLARWQWAADWIATNATRLKPAVLRQFEALAERIPETAPWERAA